MDFIFSTIGFLSLALHVFCQWALGRAVVTFIVSTKEGRPNGFAVEYTSGLLTYLALLLLLKCLGVPWWLACYAPYLLTLGSGRREYYRDLFVIHLPNTWNHVLWSLVQIIIGMTLFDSLSGSIVTPWKNAYGDFPFHFGMISSFALADAFPPEQFFYAGQPLSYPFFINLWSASLWFWSPSYYFLSVIFLVQWVLLWEVFYQAVDGDSNTFIPWLLLLAGGTFSSLGENSGTMIGSGLSFTSFLTTIWVPQRSGVFGAAVASVILQLFFHWHQSREERRPYLLIAGFLLGLSPLVHTHICFIVGVFIFLNLLVYVVYDGAAFKDRLKQTSLFVGYALLSLHALPFLLGKQSIMKLGGHGFFPDAIVSGDLFYSLVFQSIWPLLIAIALIWIGSQAHRQMIILLLLVAFAWTVRVSVWEWDQIKFFVGLYIILLSILATSYRQMRGYVLLLPPLLCIPSAYEVGKIVEEAPRSEIFSAQRVSDALKMREQLPKDAILLAAPDHNGAAILTGRTLYVGYDGWLWSHGINYQERKKRIAHLSSALVCTEAVCPNYLVWTDGEKRFWKRSLPSPMAQLKAVSPILYEITE
ncbi:MAG: hypothetical protein KDD70_14665 [Bdellovibrionales bacterium]|nr:hypothetical protein [Bdellovibrionales bacterium]